MFSVAGKTRKDSQIASSPRARARANPHVIHTALKGLSTNHPQPPPKATCTSRTGESEAQGHIINVIRLSVSQLSPLSQGKPCTVQRPRTYQDRRASARGAPTAAAKPAASLSMIARARLRRTGARPCRAPQDMRPPAAYRARRARSSGRRLGRAGRKGAGSVRVLPGVASPPRSTRADLICSRGARLNSQPWIRSGSSHRGSSKVRTSPPALFSIPIGQEAQSGPSLRSCGYGEKGQLQSIWAMCWPRFFPIPTRPSLIRKNFSLYLSSMIPLYTLPNNH